MTKHYCLDVIHRYSDGSVLDWYRKLFDTLETAEQYISMLQSKPGKYEICLDCCENDKVTTIKKFKIPNYRYQGIENADGLLT